MILKLTIAGWRFTFSYAPITKVIGVNSTLPSGDHIILWDFDATHISDVMDELLRVQSIYNLPNIYIAETTKGRGYHAYCLKRVEWRKLVEILAFTKHLDWNYFKYGIYRNHFTLRVGPKCGRTIHYVRTLYSETPEDVTIHELKSWVKYETLSNGRPSIKKELMIP